MKILAARKNTISCTLKGKRAKAIGLQDTLARGGRLRFIMFVMIDLFFFTYTYLYQYDFFLLRLLLYIFFIILVHRGAHALAHHVFAVKLP